MSIDAIVADANVLLSCVIGKAALRVITEYNVRIHVTQFNTEEVSKYLPVMAGKYSLPQDVIELQWKMLPIHIHAFPEYEEKYHQTYSDLSGRDPEDAHALALARTLKLSLWSNDRDLHNWEVNCYSTAQLLNALNREEVDK